MRGSLGKGGSLTSTITFTSATQFLTPSLAVKLNDANFGATSNNTNVSALNMDGGTLQTLGFGTAVNSGGGNGSAVINFNGGTIKAGNAGNTSFLSGLASINVYSGSGTIDNNGQNITVCSPKGPKEEPVVGSASQITKPNKRRSLSSALAPIRSKNNFGKA